MEKNYTYLLECADGTLYCGWTNHLEERLLAHNEGRGAKYTKSRRPVALVYYEAFATKQEAMQREWAVKQLTRREKDKLIAGWVQPDGKDEYHGESQCSGDGQFRNREEYTD